MSFKTDEHDYSIWSFCYAKGQLPRDFIEGSPIASNRGIVQTPMVYSAIAAFAGGRRTGVYLVDTGFASGRSMTGRSFADFEDPRAILAKVELEPSDIKTILLTHMHFDHLGNIDAFPDAEIILQRCEYEGWKRALSELGAQPSDKSNWVLSSMNLADVERLDHAIAAGRVRFVEGKHQVAPGLTLHLAADTHTFGSQWLEVATSAGTYAVAGDAIVSFANAERMWPPGYHQGNAWNLLEVYRSVKEIVGPDWPRRIVPGHDMELFGRLSHWTAGSNPVAEVHVAAGQKSFLPGPS